MRLSINKLIFASIFFIPMIILFYINSLWSGERRFYPEEYTAGDGNRITFSVDKCMMQNGVLYASGWAFIDTAPGNQKLFITIKRKDSYYMPNLMINNRMDVSKVFKRSGELDHSGFSFSAKLQDARIATFTINILSNGVLFSESHTCH